MTTLTWRNRCQKCKKLVESTRHRTVYTKNYVGSCGDSFCYASCDMETCKPITATICDDCNKAIAKEPKP